MFWKVSLDWFVSRIKDLRVGFPDFQWRLSPSGCPPSIIHPAPHTPTNQPTKQTKFQSERWRKREGRGGCAKVNVQCGKTRMSNRQCLLMTWLEDQNCWTICLQNFSFIVDIGLSFTCDPLFRPSFLLNLTLTDTRLAWLYHPAWWGIWENLKES